MGKGQAWWVVVTFAHDTEACFRGCPVFWKVWCMHSGRAVGCWGRSLLGGCGYIRRCRAIAISCFLQG